MVYFVACFFVVLGMLFLFLVAAPALEWALHKYEIVFVFAVVQACAPFARRGKMAEHNEQVSAATRPKNVTKKQREKHSTNHQNTNEFGAKMASKIDPGGFRRPVGGL